LKLCNNRIRVLIGFYMLSTVCVLSSTFLWLGTKIFFRYRFRLISVFGRYCNLFSVVVRELFIPQKRFDLRKSCGCTGLRWEIQTPAPAYQHRCMMYECCVLVGLKDAIMSMAGRHCYIWVMTTSIVIAVSLLVGALLMYNLM